MAPRDAPHILERDEGGRVAVVEGRRRRDESDGDSDDEGVVRDDMVARDDGDDGESSDDGDMDAE